MALLIDSLESTKVCAKLCFSSPPQSPQAADDAEWPSPTSLKLSISNALVSRKYSWTAAMATVDVIVDRGVVNLWGVVCNEEEKNAIRVAAEETPSVQSVNDHLRVYS
jgi:osmotically-inducible protein OsmY